MMLSGGAPLSSDTHEFIRVCLSVPLVQVIFVAHNLDFISLHRGGSRKSYRGIIIFFTPWPPGDENNGEGGKKLFDNADLFIVFIHFDIS